MVSDEVLDDTKEELKISNKELKISREEVNTLTKRCDDQANDLKAVRATLKVTEKTLKATQKELDGWIENAEKLRQINEELEEELAAKSGGVGDDSMFQFEESIAKNIKVTVQTVFRLIKFVSSDKQLELFGDMVMNNLGIKELKFPAAPADPKNVEKVRMNRVAFRNTYHKIWRTYLNEDRATAQVFDL
jgi:hypothetical protein